ncbi:ABC transporter ATP-binding protein [Microbaculum marinisediminis]|uniref:Nickel import system ATP-binding protein NikD n=1 Tax=Microbaculum marinisediminis TaxID=2931392 RepID=A0AAW5R241_9HYPH|nr:ABC transporter ATP-binding protein [Microbaculum sp. A6E488]MCT8974282.1 ABC transporter ATP-binding protein [Microbaculum sp. A6E488]
MQPNSSAHAAGATEPGPLLEVRDLRTHFFTEAGVVKAVNGVTLSVGEGEALAIVGESGSGKSVTGLTVMRLLERTTARVVGGSITFRDRRGRALDLLAMSDSQMQAVRGNEIAMIFQDPMSSLNPVFTVGEQIAEAVRVHLGKDRRTAWSAAIDLLSQVGISDPERRAASFPHQLSGGMRQRVMIALALACDPRLLIADEPTTALDVTIQAQIIELLGRLQRERRMAMIFVTHDLKLVGEVADRVAVMYASQVVEEGDVEEVLARPRHPYTKALISCIPRRDYSSPQGRVLHPIPGTLPNPLSPPEGCRFNPRCAYAVDRCRTQDPPLEDVRPGHTTACFRWKELEG